MCRQLRDRNMQLEARSHAKAMDAEYGQTVVNLPSPLSTRFLFLENRESKMADTNISSALFSNIKYIEGRTKM